MPTVDVYTQDTQLCVVVRLQKINSLVLQHLHSLQMDSSGKDFCSQYDLVVVFPWSEDDSNPNKPHVVEIMRRVSEARLETFSYLSIQKDEVSELGSE